MNAENIIEWRHNACISQLTLINRSYGCCNRNTWIINKITVPNYIVISNIISIGYFMIKEFKLVYNSVFSRVRKSNFVF